MTEKLILFLFSQLLCITLPSIEIEITTVNPTLTNYIFNLMS